MPEAGMARILLYGTDRGRFRDARALLRRDGHEVVRIPALGTWAILEQEAHPQLVVAATSSPGEVLATRRRRTRAFAPPVLFVHLETDRVDEAELEDRLVDRIVSPFQSEELLARVEALVGAYRLLHGDPTEDRATRSHRWSAIWRRVAGPTSPRPRPTVPRLQVATRLAEWSDRRDSFEVGHAERVGALCTLIGGALGIDEREAAILNQAAALHDIGKVVLPAEILHHDGPLDDVQRRMVRAHPRRGAALVRLLDPNPDVERAVLCHHERPDGSGYFGYKGEEIPRAAAILAVAECFDAMTTTRVGPRLPLSEALRQLHSTKGRLHDADAVEALADRLRPRADVIPLSTPTPHSPQH
jgi:HD-GYP domain-containing protein (c-di-GMP phosphodiesterase class II)